MVVVIVTVMVVPGNVEAGIVVVDEVSTVGVGDKVAVELVDGVGGTVPREGEA